MRDALVSRRFAVAMLVRPSFFADLGKASQFSRAAGRASRAAAKSSGSMPASGPSSIVHDPSAFAASITRMPAGASIPAASSSVRRALLVAAQPLPRRRGENHWPTVPSSNVRTGPSIQPKQSAWRTASS